MDANRVKFQPLQRTGPGGLPFTSPQWVTAGLTVLGVIAGMGAGHPLAGLGFAPLGVLSAVVEKDEYRLSEWVPVAARYAKRRVKGKHVYVDGNNDSPLSDSQLLSWPIQDGEMAVVKSGTTYTAILEVESRSPILEDDSEIDAFFTQWQAIQERATKPASHISRLAWYETAGPVDPLAAERWADEHGVLDSEHPTAISYRNLIRRSRGSIRHSIHIAVQLDATRTHTKRAIRLSSSADDRKTGYAKADVGACHTIERMAAHLQADLETAHKTCEVLSPFRLAGVLRTRFDPSAAQKIAAQGGSFRSEPMGSTDQPNYFRHDGGWTSITGKVLKLPERPVDRTFLWKLLLSTGDYYRTIACVFETKPPDAALTRTEWQVILGDVIGEKRRTWDIWNTRRAARKDQAASEIEAEVVDGGHHILPPNLYISVTAPDLEQAELAYASVEQDAEVLELGRCFMQHQERFLTTLPLARMS